MKLFDFLRPKSKNKKLIDEKVSYSGKDGQMQATAHALDILRNYDVTDDTELKLEYFFYTKTSDDATRLENEMKKLGYIVYERIAEDNSEKFSVIGLTTKIKMDDHSMEQWVEQMRKIADKFDCEFDGWGTIPNQDELGL